MSLLRSKVRTLVSILVAFFLASSFAAAQCVPATDPGAKICSPVNGSTVTSPVHVVVGTADSAHRVTEINVYVDNVSVYKTTTASSVDTNITIAPGAHTLRIQVWDTTGTIYRDSVNFTVSSSTPPPSCAPPTSPGIVVCTPQNGATVSSPVPVQAYAMVTGTIYRFELWSDNVKVASVSNSGTMNVSVPMSSGAHAWTFVARNTDSTSRVTKSMNITVSGGTTPPPTCAPATDPGAKICTPTDGSTVTSPFAVNVVTKDSAHPISAIYTYIDNVVVNKTNAATASFSATAANGTHNLRVQAWDSTGAIYRDSVNITVGTSTPPPPSGVAVTPKQAVVTPELTQQFTASTTVNWSVDGIAGGDATVGTISASGLYTPPSTAGLHTITATSTADATQTGTAKLYVSTYAGTFTYHNDIGRTGQNTQETVLTPSNVNTSNFGKLFSRSVDGFVFAQPLYVRNVNIGGAHNVVYVATQHASVYAFDAEGRSSSPLWKRSFINPTAGINVVTNTEVGSSDSGPEVSITSTPVIDTAAGTMYVLVRTNENGTYFQRLHAISLTTGADKMTAATIAATVNGSGVGGDGAGHISFNPLIQNQRCALLLANGNIYLAWASHGDNGAYHGWVMVYNASTLAKVAVWNLTANGKEGGIWMAGSGPAADSNGYVYLTTGNGTNDVAGSNIDFGDAYIKVQPNLTLQDFFSPYDQSALNAGDLDIAASGVVVLPDQSGTHPHLLVGSGKRGDIYVVDRDNMGGFNASSNGNIVQYLPRAVGQNTAEDQFFGVPSYWNGNMYFAGSFDHLKQFTMTNGLLSTSAVHVSPQALSTDRSAEPIVSANGTSGGIVWVIATDTYQTSNPLVLHAYDATNVGNELWNSAQNATRDAGGKVVKFTTPTVANGRVYVGTRNTLDVYGLLP